MILDQRIDWSTEWLELRYTRTKHYHIISEIQVTGIYPEWQGIENQTTVIIM